MFLDLKEIETEMLKDELMRRKREEAKRIIDPVIRMVQEYHPEVRGVIFTRDAWLYVDANRNAPDDWRVPDSKIPLLEKALCAAEEVYNGNCAFFLDECAHEFAPNFCGLCGIKK